MAEASGAGVDHDGDLPLFVQPHYRRCFFVEYLVDRLHLEEVVAGPQRAKLRPAP